MRLRRKRIGIYDPYLGALGGGEHYVTLFAEALSGDHDVTLVGPAPFDLRAMGERFAIDLSAVHAALANGDGSLPPTQRTPKRWLGRLLADRRADLVRSAFTRDFDVFVCLSNGIPNYNRARRGILLLQMPSDGWRGSAAQERTAKARLRRSIFGSSLTLEEMLKLRSYDVKVANSRFTKRWLDRQWGIKCRVTYMGSHTDRIRPLEKERIILSVGRFQPDVFPKNQHLLIEAFRELCDAGLRGWEFHLVGGVRDRAEQCEYYERLRRRAQGYPIALHPNVSFREIAEWYGRSRIFWHATGCDADEDRQPWRVEHFGLTTVEAMAGGCVPIVVGRGGQPEIVRDGIDGYLWDHLGEMKQRTVELICDTARTASLSVAARARSTMFSRERFRAAVRRLMSRL